VPRYLVPQRPPAVPRHAGTTDVDVVFDLQIVGQTEAYLTLEENLKQMGFERGTNDHGTRVSWRWQKKTEQNHLVLVEFLVDDPEHAGGKVMELQTDTGISVMNIPYSTQGSRGCPRSRLLPRARSREARGDRRATEGTPRRQIRARGRPGDTLPC